MANKLFKLKTESLFKSPNDKVNIKGSVFAVLKDVEGEHKGRIQVFKSKNIVCNDGDLYYAQMAANETPTNDFTAGGLKLGTGVTAPTRADTDIETLVANSYKAESSGYPKTNCTDANNGGGGTDKVTWKYFYDTTECNVANINECAICSEDAAPPTAILTHAHFSSAFTKLNTQTLTVFINHEFDGS